MPPSLCARIHRFLYHPRRFCSTVLNPTCSGTCNKNIPGKEIPPPFFWASSSGVRNQRRTPYPLPSRAPGGRALDCPSQFVPVHPHRPPQLIHKHVRKHVRLGKGCSRSDSRGGGFCVSSDTLCVNSQRYAPLQVL